MASSPLIVQALWQYFRWTHPSSVPKLNFSAVDNLLRRLLVLVRAGPNSEVPGHDGDDDDDDDEHSDTQAPPLELAGVASVLDAYFHLFVSFLHVDDSILGVVLGNSDYLILLLNHAGEVGVQSREVHQGLLDALQLIVAGANVAKNGASMSSSVCAKLDWNTMLENLNKNRLCCDGI